jgi:DNA-binding transcriptional LysR family regulator
MVPPDPTKNGSGDQSRGRSDVVSAHPSVRASDQRKRIEFRHLRSFVTVAEESSIGRAAIRLNIAQPPLSQQIKQLETWLGSPVFHRTPKGVELTPAGEEFLRHATVILRQMDDAVDAVRQLEWGNSGELCVGCVYSTVRLFQSGIMRLVEKKFPRLTLEFKAMHVNDQMRALRDSTIDIGLVTLPIREKLIQNRMLLKSSLVLAAPKKHRLAKKKSVHLADIEREMPGLPGITGHFSFRKQATAIFKRQGLLAPGLQAVSDIGLLMELVEAGMGLAVVPECIDQKSYPKAAFITIEDALPPFALHVAWRTDTVTPLRAAFVDFLTRLNWVTLSRLS